jgi:hypothetical protein
VPRSLILILLASLLLAGCGFWSDDETSTRPSIDDAETCVDVADYLAVVAQDFIDDAEKAGIGALRAGPDSELFQRYGPQIQATQDKADELGCDEDEMRPLIAERLDGLKTSGTVGESIVALIRQELVGN